MASKNLLVLSDFVSSVTLLTASAADVRDWLMLQSYCTEKENGGVLVGAERWPDVAWDSVFRRSGAGVAQANALANAGLGGFHEGNFLAFGYDIAGEFSTQATAGLVKFDAPQGSKGARARGAIKADMRNERIELEMRIAAARVRVTVNLHGNGHGERSGTEQNRKGRKGTASIRTVGVESSLEWIPPVDSEQHDAEPPDTSVEID